MKRICLIILLFCSIQSFGQTITHTPEIDDQVTYDTDITKVELRDEFTIISFSYQYSNRRSQNYNFPIPLPNQRPQQSTATISINPKSYLNGNGKRFKYIRATGIPELPDSKPVSPGQVYNFTVYYERLDPGIELFNLIEGKNSPEQTLQFWNFYGVHIRNPLRKIPTASTGPITLTVKGKIIDAKTQKPIMGRVVYQFDKNAAKKGSAIVSASGNYSFALSPDAYTFTAIAKGYESEQASLDLSKIKKNQQFTQNIYLNPVVEKIVSKPVQKETSKKVPSEVEQPKVKSPVVDTSTVVQPKEETAPVKVEENKFRLDKVYFNTGESGLLPESFEQLNGLLKMMKNSPTMTIIIEGHTDNIGDPGQNKRLSLERAFNVREYLISKGIAGKRIQFKGYGDTKPIADNATEEGKKLNRRVEFVILKP
ncbi:OmpA family protein [Emticicia sp. BO119]|uniref:OmpA family protein n=1 Tax=Emticicia sp. BO119 TaxID=2757768 RepID=UPI0015F08CB9|nr:OmpA family protein [Emticicia sp. BO119]MBA4849721.1 OmpA family protein [Emticicia sp. BO119]